MGKRRHGIIDWGVAADAFVFVAPFVLTAVAVMNAFYVFGDMEDIGWFSHAAWHNGFALTGPPTHPFSFFNVHIAPVLWLTNLLSYLLPFSQISFWAALNAAIYTGFAVLAYRLWLGEAQDARAKMIAAAVALAATFGAIGTQALRLPHLEMGIPFCCLWFFLLLARGEARRALIPFILCLTIREDAGFHLFGLLFVTGAIFKISGRAMPCGKAALRFAVAGFIYSIAALTIKSLFFMQMDNMAYVYTGTPAWAHLNRDLIEARIGYFLTARSFIYAPFLLACMWAYLARNPLMMGGYVAALPWLAWNWAALRPNPAHLDFYYAFPFWTALVWPLVAHYLWNGAGARMEKRWVYAAMLLFSLIGWNKDHITVYPLARGNATGDLVEGNPFVVRDAWLHPHEIKSFTDYFAANQGKFANAAMDMPLLGMVIDTNKSVGWIGYWNDAHHGILPDMIVYLGDAYEWEYWVKPTMKSFPNAYRYFYRVPGTKIRLAADQPIEALLPMPSPFVAGEKPVF